jgi:hypothetical protein
MPSLYSPLSCPHCTAPCRALAVHVPGRPPLALIPPYRLPAAACPHRAQLNSFINGAIFSTLTNVNFDDEAFRARFLREAEQHFGALRACVQRGGAARGRLHHCWAAGRGPRDHQLRCMPAGCAHPVMTYCGAAAMVTATMVSVAAA